VMLNVSCGPSMLANLAQTLTHEELTKHNVSATMNCLQVSTTTLCTLSWSPPSGRWLRCWRTTRTRPAPMRPAPWATSSATPQLSKSPASQLSLIVMTGCTCGSLQSDRHGAPHASRCCVQRLH
jgi:hypothetical protein